MRKTILSVLALAAISGSAFATATVDFEELAFPQGQNYFNGGPNPNTNGFTSKGFHFNNNYDTTFGEFWTGFSYSKVNNPNVGGSGNQYASAAGVGADGSANYGIAFESPFINLRAGETPVSVRATNTAYTKQSLLTGDMFAKKFGGASGNDADFFSVVFTGHASLDGAGAPTGSAEFFLADYRFANNAQDYIVSTWDLVNLSGLSASTRSISLSFTSSDLGQFGINTPVYVAIDNLSTVPEPVSGVAILAGAAMILRRRK